jgi:ribosomal protein L16 Arg81 hydroxylase
MHTLAQLVAPGSLEVFLDHFAAKTRWLLRADAAERAQALLPWSEIDRLIAAHGIPADWLSVQLNKNTADPRMYRDERSRLLRSDRLQELAAQGASFVIPGISELIPPIAALSAAIERQLGVAVSVNCYVSFGSHSAFLSHHDGHDVLVLQVHGAKLWRCYGADVASPLKGGQYASDRAVLWEDTLRPGDVLYLPRGEIHAAVPAQPPSVHLTFGIKELTGVDFIKWLGDKAGRDVVFRQDLAKGAPADRHQSRETELKAALHALIDATPVVEFLADDDRKRPLRAVAAFDFAHRLRADSVLVSALRRKLDLEIENDDEIKIEIGGNPIRLAALARRALDAATARDRVTFAALAAALGRDTEDRDLIASLTVLARNALIEIVA